MKFDGRKWFAVNPTNKGFRCGFYVVENPEEWQDQKEFALIQFNPQEPFCHIIPTEKIINIAME